ncbi:MAG: sulfite oxidase [Deltaproteobacteria bacterium]|nr:sulfite oxidase [Deltaproteobacteria bacterium]
MSLRIGRRALLAGGGVALASGPELALADGGAPDPLLLLRHGGAPHHNLATPIELFDRAITPTPAFFVRSHFGAPSLDRARKLAVDGMVKTSLSLSPEELEAQFPAVTITTVLQCAGNGRSLHQPRVPGIQWVHGAMGQATFTGVRLKDVLTKAGLAKEGRHVRIQGADAAPKPSVPAFVRSLPIERAMDPTTLVAFRMNGEPLTLAHGAPLRLVVPGWAGDHWVKWLTSVRVQKEEEGGFFMKTAYRMPTEPVAPGAAAPPEKMQPASTFPVKSIIARPTEGAKRPMGRQEVVGLAFSGEAPIAEVEVSIDGGKTFAPAKLEGEGGVARAQVFRFTFEQKTPGAVHVVARAKDKKGSMQPESPAWNPSGYFWNGWHRVSFEVTP